MFAVFALIGALSAALNAAVLPNGMTWAYLKGPQTTGDGGTYSPKYYFDSGVIPAAQSYVSTVTDAYGEMWFIDRSVGKGAVFSFDGIDFKLWYISSVSAPAGVYTGGDPHPGNVARPAVWPRPTTGGFSMRLCASSPFLAFTISRA